MLRYLSFYCFNWFYLGYIHCQEYFLPFLWNLRNWHHFSNWLISKLLLNSDKEFRRYTNIMNSFCNLHSISSWFYILSAKYEAKESHQLKKHPFSCCKHFYNSKHYLLWRNLPCVINPSVANQSFLSKTQKISRLFIIKYSVCYETSKLPCYNTYYM